MLEHAVIDESEWLAGLCSKSGKVLIGLHIGKQALESTYGAASSIVVVLIWVYYNAQIVLVGAEFTRVYAEHHGSRKSSSPGEFQAYPAAFGNIDR